MNTIITWIATHGSLIIFAAIVFCIAYGTYLLSLFFEDDFKEDDEKLSPTP